MGEKDKQITEVELRVMGHAVPELPEAQGRSCEVFGCHRPPCSQPGEGAGPEIAQSPRSQRCTAAPAEVQLLHAEETATRSPSPQPTRRSGRQTWHQTDSARDKTSLAEPDGSAVVADAWGQVFQGRAGGLRGCSFY